MELIATPLRQKQKGFVLTSLIDVIFLLLVFFMLSSQIAPYSLLTVSGGASQQESTTQAAPSVPANATSDMMFIVSRGHVRAGSETIPLDQLPAALKRLRDGKQLNATVLTTRSATVQDIVTALEIFETARIASVRLLMTPS